MRGALAGLSPRQRAVLVLRYYEDLTERETAEALGVAVGTVKSHHRDARRCCGAPWCSPSDEALPPR